MASIKIDQVSNTINPLDYIPKRFGLAYNPPQIVVEYQKPSSGKLYHHKLKLQKLLSLKSKISEIIEEIYKNHNIYLNHNKVSKAQIIQLVEKLKEKYVLNENKNDLNRKNSLKYDIGINDNFNGLSIEELNAKKAYMDKFYDKNNIKVGDKNFQYDIRKDFVNDGNAEWDEDEEIL
jgi:hypothetical protein